MYSPDGQSAYNNLRHLIREQILSSMMCSQTALRLTQILDDYTLDVNSIWNYDFHNLTDIIYDIRCFKYDFIYCESFDDNKCRLDAWKDLKWMVMDALTSALEEMDYYNKLASKKMNKIKRDFIRENKQRDDYINNF